MQHEFLRRYYKAMTNDELLERARNAGSFAVTSLQALLQEMRERELNEVVAIPESTPERLERRILLEYLRQHAWAPGRNRPAGRLGVIVGSFLLLALMSGPAHIGEWFGGWLSRQSGGHVDIWVGVVLCGALSALPLLLVLKFLRKSHALLASDAFEILERDKRRHVLYLRSFRDDERNRHVLVDITYKRPVVLETKTLKPLERIGPVISVGNPADSAYYIAFPRFMFREGEWQNGVSLLMKTAARVVLRVSETPGLLWELRSALKMLPPERLILELPFDDGKVDNANLREKCRTALQQVNGILPAPIPEEPVKAFVRFSGAWESSFVDIHEVVRGV